MTNVRITVKPPITRPSDEDDFREVWPTMLPDDEGPPTKISIQFFDAATRRTNPEIEESTSYEIIPDWAAPIEEKAVHGYNLTAGCTQFNNYRTQINMHYIGNDFLIPQSILNREFKDKDIKERWKRYPLHGPGFETSTLQQHERDTDKRWPMFADDYNLRVFLKRSLTDDYSLDCSPDLNKDGKAKGRAKLKKETKANEPLEVKSYFPRTGRFGIKVEEVGTKTIAHFINKPNLETTNYTAEWLEPFGIYYCPFDTTDSDNVKVTREPLFDADEVDGKFISIKPKTDIKVFLVPRQWAHYCRLGKQSVTENPVASISFSSTHTGMGYGAWEDSSSVCMCDHTDWGGADCTSCDCWYGTAVNCSGTTSSSGCTLVVSEYYATYFNFTTETTYFWTETPTPQCVYTETGSMWYTGGEPCLDFGSGSVTTEYRGDIYQRTLDTYIGLWWDRFQWLSGIGEGITAGNPQPEDEKGSFTFRWSTDGSSYVDVPVTFIADESYSEAIANEVNTDEEDGDKTKRAQKKIVGGFNSFHLYSGTPDIELKAFWDRDTEYYLVWRSTPACNEFPKGDIYGTYFQFNDALGLKNRSAAEFWQMITRSKFWENYGQYSDEANDGYITNSVPYGMGLSPNKEGSLIGIVLVDNSKPYFVWRKTDEVFEERLLKVSGDYNGHFVSFEGDTNYFLDPFASNPPESQLSGGIASQLTYFSGERRRLDKICRKVSSVGCGANSLANYRYKAANSACWVSEAQEGEVELERPVYVVFSREAPFLAQSGHHSDSSRCIRQEPLSPERCEGDYWIYPL